MGMPVSTTPAITTSIMGVGCAKRFSAIKLHLVERIVWAWILTIPATSAVAFAVVWLGNATGWLKITPHEKARKGAACFQPLNEIEREAQTSRKNGAARDGFWVIGWRHAAPLRVRATGRGGRRRG